jgi:hypothetical protein
MCDRAIFQYQHYANGFASLSDRGKPYGNSFTFISSAVYYSAFLYGTLVIKEEAGHTF